MKNKKTNKSMRVVIFSFIFVTIYVIVNIVLSTKGTNLDSTLTEWVFKFFGLEMLGLSGIKISKNVGSAFGKVEEAIDGMIVNDNVE
jgi:hypothetical protein